jgi:N,N-dimethylformamidase
MQALTGYADKMSVAPGEMIHFMVSAEQNQAYTARLVRVICGDSNPQRPGLKFEPVSSSLDGEYQGQRQTTDAGSYMVAENLPALALDGGISFAVMIWPTLLERADQTIMALWNGQGMSGVRLALLKGVLALIVTDASGQTESIMLGALVLPRRWYLVRFSIDATGQVFLAQRAMDPSPFSEETAEHQERLNIFPPSLPQSIYLAGCPGPNKSIESHYNGKLDGPTVWSGVVDDTFVIAHRMRALSSFDLSRAILQWDFSRDVSGTAVRDCGPYRCDGRLVHLPARAMKGWNWTGDHYDWRVKPDIEQGDIESTRMTTPYTEAKKTVEALASAWKGNTVPRYAREHDAVIPFPTVLLQVCFVYRSRLRARLALLRQP